MKKNYLVMMMALLSFVIYAQTKPIMGYDKVEWGASPEDVKKAYGLDDSVQLQVAQSDSNISKLTITNVSNTISQKHFQFNKNKLYRVVVVYVESDMITTQKLIDGLTSKFGSYKEASSNHSGSILGTPVNQKLEIWTYSKYYPDLLVEIMRGTSDSVLIDDTLCIRYTWQKFLEDYQASQQEY